MSSNTNVVPSTTPVLTSLPQLDTLRLGSATSPYWERQNGSNLDIFKPFGESFQSLGEMENSPLNTIGFPSASPLALCHLDAVNHFEDAGRADQPSYEEAAALALAAHHLNTGDGSIVPNVTNLNHTCPIRFSVSFFDTKEERGEALRYAADVTTANIDANGFVSSGTKDDEKLRRPPCAFLGAYVSRVSMAMGILTGVRGYPQISPGSTSTELDDKEQFPLFGRTIPSDQGNAVAVIRFFYDSLRIRHLGVIHINDAFGISFIAAMLEAVEDLGLDDFTIFSAGVNHDDNGSIRNAIASLKETQVQYFFCINYGIETHDFIMEEAYQKGIAGTGLHNWFFADSFNGVLGNREFPRDSPLHKAYIGTGIIQATAGVPGIKTYDLFLEKLSELDNPLDLEYLSSIVPRHNSNGVSKGFEGMGFKDFLQKPSSVFSAFAYDAAIGLGLSACAIIAEQQRESLDGEELHLDGTEHYQHLIQSAFDGASGSVVFDPETGSRTTRSAQYVVTNFKDVDSTGFESITFDEVIAYKSDAEEWVQSQAFVFNDGTSLVRPGIPDQVVEDNCISTAVRATILIFSGIIILMSLGFMYWTNKNKRSRVVLSSQPFFLYIICFGIMLVGSAIIPLSLDHSILSIQGATMACTATYWLLALGFAITVSAFGAKTRRVNKILNSGNKLRRIKVTITDVARPMIILLSLNILLLTLMTVLTPPKYEIIVEDFDNFGRASEQRGTCEHDPIPFELLNLLVNSFNFCSTFQQAWNAKKLSCEFSESRYIFRALIAIVLIVFVGVPLVFLAKENVNAQAFVRGAIIFLSCFLTLLLTFVPKINFLLKRSNEKGNSTRVRISGMSFKKKKSSRSWRASSGNESSRKIQWNIQNSERPTVATLMNVSTETHLEQGHSEEFTGVKILSTKTPSELLQENEELSEALEHLRDLINTSDDIENLREDLIQGVELVDDSSSTYDLDGTQEKDIEGESFRPRRSTLPTVDESLTETGVESRIFSRISSTEDITSA